MLKLRDIYFRKFTLLFISLFIIVGFILYFWLKEIYIKKVEESLKNEIVLISLHIKDGANLDRLVKDIKENINTRVTIIQEDGKVIAESHKDKKKMDNHKYREEIMSAKTSTFGKSIRHSKTLNKDLLYVAKKIKVEDKTLYIRVAKEIKKIDKDLSSLAIQIGIVLVIFFILAFYIAYKISTQLQVEIKKMMKFLLDLTKKQKNSHIVSNFSKEFYDISKLLTKISKILAKQDKQKAKYTAKLKKSNEQKDDIISAISHEFKNPIAVINGYSQTLLNDKDINPEIREKFLSKIETNGKNLSLLIDKLRLSIKLDEKKLKLNLTKVDICNLCENIISDLKENFKNREISLICKSQPKIEADSMLLEIAISNLIENALKYSEDRVDIEICNDKISIKDSGIGISQKELDKITKKFYRVSQNGWNNSLGLGLSIVSNILKLHNFKLKINSEENEGSKFSIIWKN